MPGANYFLSKLATQTPGPLVGSPSIKSEPFSGLELVPVSSLVQDDLSTSFTSYGNCRQVAFAQPKDSEVYASTYSTPVVGQYISPGNRGALCSPLPISMKGLEENPVGELQELCTKMRWVFPSYAVCCENGQPHERTFVIAVRLYNIKDKGEAKSKKAAKREAARRLLFQLLERSAGQRYSQEKPTPAIEYRSPSDSSSKQSLSRQLQPYKDSPPHSKCIEMLQELAGRRNLRVLYIHLDSKSSSGLIQVMLQITTCPIIVVRGQGRTLLEAKADAALNALECIRITAKKVPFHTMNFS